MTLPRTLSGALNCQETEIVFITSSPAKEIGLPAPCVMKRKDGHYMRPRYPASPTFARRKVISTSGSRAARFKRDFVQTSVSELEVGHFQPVDPSNGRDALPVNIINLQWAPVFSPSEEHTSSFSQLMSLDMLPARGLLEVDFWKLFSKCGACSNFMTSRTVPYHECPMPATQLYDSIQVIDLAMKNQYFLRLLDVHGIGGAAGVSETHFKAIFYACGQCGRYMTARLLQNHHEDADLDDYRCINLVVDAASSSIVRKKFFTEFPSLELL